MEGINHKLFYTPEEFRKILGCSRAVIYEALHQQKIRSFKLGRKFFIPTNEIGRLNELAGAARYDAPITDPDLW